MKSCFQVMISLNDWWKDPGRPPQLHRQSLLWVYLSSCAKPFLKSYCFLRGCGRVTVYTAARMVHLQECTRTWHRIVTLCKVCRKCLCLHRGRAEHTLDLNMLLQIESHWLPCVSFHLSSHKNLWSSTQQKLSLWLTPHPTPKQGSKRCRSPQAALQLLYFTFELIYFEKKGS